MHGPSAIKYKINGQTLTFESGANVTFDDPIRKALAFPAADTIVVCLEITGRDGRNVYGIDLTGRRRWQIADVGTTCYVGIAPGEFKNSVLAMHFEGMVYDIDVVTGKVLKATFCK